MGQDVVITAAIVGAELTREQTPYLPFTPEEIAGEARRCWEAGAAVIHLHVRDALGRASQDARLFQLAVEAIRAEVDVVVQVSTGGAVGMGVEERLGGLSAAPEMATLNCGTTNFGDEVFENPLPLMRQVARRIAEVGVVPELELYELGHLDNALLLVRERLVTPPLHLQWVLGVRGAMSASAERLAFLVSQLPAETASWGVAGIGRQQFPMVEAALRLGGNVRVGLEDNIYLEKGVLAQGSAPLVERAARMAHAAGRQPASPAAVREQLDHGRHLPR